MIPLGSAASAVSSIFDERSRDQKVDVGFKTSMRGTAMLAPFTEKSLSYSCVAAPTMLPPKKIESLFQDEQDVDDL